MSIHYTKGKVKESSEQSFIEMSISNGVLGRWFKKVPKLPYVMLNGSLPVKSDDGHRMIPGIDRNRAAGASWRAAKAKNKVRNCLCGNISIKSTDSTRRVE